MSEGSCKTMRVMAKEAIDNTDWDSYWKKVDVEVAKDAEAYRESRRRSVKDMNNIVLD